ncbi:porin [Aquamicrobium sp. NLF2-7]|uniref:porin n=1 Tax=Aquamicrobium sp. NLF2-7 TaxID=2918753 RepID=UPI001EFB740E|nr:porin [Aquamicrobium sp. NLF2-7]MCG8273938.1 porin [Aquamicrobium sp. NLF2-7]
MKARSIAVAFASALATVCAVTTANAENRREIISDPEPHDYVRVCDVFGAGFFYIPGSETCLKIGGLIRYEPSHYGSFDGLVKSSDGLDTLVRAELTFDARSDTEYGTLRGYTRLRSDLKNGSIGGDVQLRDLIMSLGPVSVGFADSLYDANISGEFDRGGADRAHFARYTLKPNDSVTFTGALEQTDSSRDWQTNVLGKLSVSRDWARFDVFGAYDTTADEFALKAIVKSDVSKTIFVEAIATYESGMNFYSVNPFAATGFSTSNLVGAARAGSEWSAGGLVGTHVTPRLKASLGAQYFSNVGHGRMNEKFGGKSDVIRAGLTVDYKIVENLNAKLAVNHTRFQTSDRDYGQWHGFLRLDRAF